MNTQNATSARAAAALREIVITPAAAALREIVITPAAAALATIERIGAMRLSAKAEQAVIDELMTLTGICALD